MGPTAVAGEKTSGSLSAAYPGLQRGALSGDGSTAVVDTRFPLVPGDAFTTHVHLRHLG